MAASEWFAPAFAMQANSLAGLYGAPVYLVGSALHSDHPNDYDVRVMLEQVDFERLFWRDIRKKDEKLPDGQYWSRLQWRMAYEGLKQSRRLSRRMMVRIDFQLQHGMQDKYKDLPRLRLDQAPDWFFQAGLTDP